MESFFFKINDTNIQSIVKSRVINSCHSLDNYAGGIDVFLLMNIEIVQAENPYVENEEIPFVIAS